MTTTQTPGWRTRLATVVEGSPVQNFVLVVIAINAITMGLETAVASTSPIMNALRVLDTAALTIFVIEIALKLVALGPKRFFTQGWNVFDFLVVGVALIPGSGPLAVLRTLRVLRILRVVKFFPQLRGVVEALMRALPGIGAIAIQMVLIYYVSAVMATVLFGAQYPEWFGNLGESVFTLFQVMTLDNWSTVVRPIMDDQPHAWLFFVPYILISAFTMLNLFIAVIVDTMQTMRSAREETEAAEVQRAADEAAKSASEMDSDAAIAQLMAQVAALRTELHQFHSDTPLPPQHRR